MVICWFHYSPAYYCIYYCLCCLRDFVLICQGKKGRGPLGDALSIFTFLAEMDFDAWREDKGEHTGGIPQCMLRMSRIPQATKQGAKCARPLSREKTRRIVWNEDNKPVTITTSTGTVTFSYDGNGNRVIKTKGSNTTYY
jgi:YD repeat-containing protein